MGRRATLVAALALSACTPTEHALVLELPPHEGAASIVVGLEAPRTLTLHALAAPDDVPVTFDTRAVGSDARLWALLYREPLDALGLSAGPLVELEGGRPLPPESRRFQATLSLGDPTPPAWSDAPARSAALAAFTIPAAPTACPDLELSLFDVPSPNRKSTSFLEALDDAHTLLGLEDGSVFLVDRAGRATPLTLSPDFEVRGARVDGEDVWLSGAEGRLARARLDDTTLTIETSTIVAEGPVLRYLDVEHTPSGVEVRGLSKHGVLAVWTPAGSRVLHRFMPMSLDDDGMGGLASVAPGEWVAVHQYSQYVVRVRDGVVTTEALPPVGAPRKIIHSDTLGTILGTTDGVFLRFDGRAWELIPGSPLTVFVASIEESGPGFFYGGTYGNLGYWEPSTGYCPLSRPVDFHLENMLRVGTDLWISGQNQDSDRTPFAVLRRR